MFYCFMRRGGRVVVELGATSPRAANKREEVTVALVAGGGD
jgi:hypothetical protein